MQVKMKIMYQVESILEKWVLSSKKNKDFFFHLQKNVSNEDVIEDGFCKVKGPDSLASFEFIHVHFEAVVTHGLHYTVF